MHRYYTLSTAVTALAVAAMTLACSNICDDLTQAQLQCAGVTQSTVAPDCASEQSQCLYSLALANEAYYCRAITKAYDENNAESLCPRLGAGRNMSFVQFLCEMDACDNAHLSRPQCEASFSICN